MSKPLQLKAINDLLGENFFIPNYQRGYRWTPKQVEDLLNDIWTFATKPIDKSKESQFYCLQPIVVRNNQWTNSDNENISGYEVIDGQQRLTTIYIIIDYLAKEFLKVDSLIEDYGKESYTIFYKTRPKSEDFLKNISNSNEDRSNIDFYHMQVAYKTIKDWFTSGENTKDRNDKNRFLIALLGKESDERSVQVIWYLVGQNIDGKELFTRLNIGKIPLTNSELIKALFLNESSFKGYSNDEVLRKKLEISQIWDDIEQNMSQDDFWSFLTNEKQAEYSTKIELLFDMMSKKSKKAIDPLYTFLYFLQESKNSNQSLWELWLRIEQYYLTIRQWYKDKNLYHKIGYLITTGENIKDLIERSLNEKKNVFEENLNERIRDSLRFDMGDLSYEKDSDYKKIEKVLLLFNIESIRSNSKIAEFYPFRFHKKVYWSIEHIHAQNSEGIDKTKKEPWLVWLNHHKKLIKEIVDDESGIKADDEWINILEEIEQLNEDTITWQTFSSLSDRIIGKLSDETDGDYDEMHSISNLALISQPSNSVLSNSAFEVKRRLIIEMDMKGHYIPLCTRRVFFKYYNNKLSTQQYYYWGKEDRENYFSEIKKVLKEYLPKGELEIQDDNKSV